MNKLKLLPILTLATISSTVLFASTDKISLKSETGISIGLQAYKYKYEEEVDGSFFMSTEATKYGGIIEGTLSIGDKYFINTEARYAEGDVRYKGTGSGNVSEDMYELKLTIGKEAYVENYLLGFYTGLGYRVLNNDLQDLGAGGYRRESYYTYIPIGVFHRTHIGESGRVSTKLEYDYLVKGEQKSYLSDVSPTYSDVTNDQNDGYGMRISTSYEEQYWSIGVFFNYWNIDDSEKEVFTPGWVAIEPKNDTKEYGVDIRIRF